MAILETAGDIITKFELYVDDTTELSSDEELDLLEQKCQDVASELPWEILKNTAALTTNGTTTVSLPSRFAYITENQNYSDDNDYAGQPVVYVGSNYDPYKLVSWSDRRSYRNRSGHCWVDMPNNTLEFAVAPANGLAVEFDYIAYPTSLTATTDVVWIPERFRNVLVHLMATDDFIIQQSEKARSYKNENEQRAKAALDSMKQWNARLIQM